MTDLILGLATQFWPMTVFIILVIIGLIINLFDKKIDNRVNFKYKERRGVEIYWIFAFEGYWK